MKRTVDGPPGAPYIAVRTRVRWGDCDPAGIVFYPRFFEWMDMASHVLAREMGISRDDMLSGLGFPLVSARAEFLGPARPDDELEVRARVSRVGQTSLALRLEVLRMGEDEVLLARGHEERVHIARDGSGVMRPREITPEMRAVLAHYADQSHEPKGGER